VYSLLRILPKNHLSYFVGSLARIPIPTPLRGWGVRLFANLVGANLDEADKQPQQYRSIADFFVRDLKPGLRPLSDGLVSPVDGAVRAITEIKSGSLEQVKGRDYLVSKLLGSTEESRLLEGGTFINLYLSPPDYHHVHAPCDLLVRGIRYIPGFLWPVNGWALQNIPELFSRNERIVVQAETDAGLIWIILVGATNVGRITLTFDSMISNGSLISNSSSRVGEERHYDTPIKLRKGERIGTFHLGSTVLLCLDPKASNGLGVARSVGPVRLGQALFSAA